MALDFILAVFCVLGIIPFTIKINKIAKYEGGVSKLSDEAIDAIYSGNEVISSNNIFRLGELCRSALKESLPYEVMSITTKIRILGNLSVENNLEKPTLQAIRELGYLGIISMDKKTDIGYYPVPWEIASRIICLPEYPIAWNLTNGLKEICIGCIDKNFDKSSVSYSCDLIFKIGYMYIQKIRTTYTKNLSPNLRLVIPSQLSLIEGDYSNSESKPLVKMLLEIAEKATKKKEIMFCWDEITEFKYQKKDLDEINNFFKENNQIMFEAYDMRKIDNGKKLMLYGGQNFDYNLELKQEDETAILIRQYKGTRFAGEKYKNEPECVNVLPTMIKNNKTYICKFKYNELLERSLIYIWIIGAYIMKYYPIHITKSVIFQIKHSKDCDIRSFFESKYIQQETSLFTITKDRRADFEDIEDYIKSFQEFYFGFEEYLLSTKD